MGQGGQGWAGVKIISGGQTGADQGGLFAGEAIGLETGGWVPKGCRTEVGPYPELVTRFGCREHESPDWGPRTEANIIDSDGTVIFGDVRSPGSRLTIRLCKQHRKPRLENPTIEEFVVWLASFRIGTLNVAGNRESKMPGIQQQVKEFLVQAIRR